MSAHTLDLEYAQSRSCLLSRKVKPAPQMKCGRHIFMVGLVRAEPEP